MANRYVSSSYYPINTTNDEGDDGGPTITPQLAFESAQFVRPSAPAVIAAALAAAAAQTSTPAVEEEPQVDSLPPPQSAYYDGGNLPLAYRVQYRMQDPIADKRAAAQAAAARTEAAPAPRDPTPSQLQYNAFGVGQVLIPATQHYAPPTVAAPVKQYQPTVQQQTLTQPLQSNVSAHRYFRYETTDDNSGYVWEHQEESAPQFTQDYNSLDYIPGFSPPLASANHNDENRPAPPQLQTLSEAIMKPASFAPSAFNQSIQNGKYALQESSYLGGIPNDLHAAYGVKHTPPSYSHNNYPIYTSNEHDETPAPATLIEDSATATTAIAAGSHSRFRPLIPSSHIGEIVDYTSAAGNKQEVLRTARAAPMIGNAFRPVVMGGASGYHFDNLNDLVSCIDMKN